jgi:hypothetical protein
MNVEAIRTRIRDFRPFRVVTSSGNRYEVPHLDFILLHERTVVVISERGYAVVLDPLHIVGLEDVPDRNGRTKRRRRR